MEKENGNFQVWSGIRPTYGEILSTGVVLELVESSSGTGVELCRWDGKNFEVAPQFQEAGIIYKAGYLHPSILEATRLARGPAEYGDAGKFFWRIADLFRLYLGFSRDVAASISQAVFATWFPDCCASPIILCITGMDMNQVMRLFRLLHILCRHPLMVASLSPNLPFYLHPTLLVNVPRMSARAGDFWRTTNYHGTFVLGPRGTMRNIACAKIVFCETEAARRAWAPEALHIALPPTDQGFASLSELEEAQLAAEYLQQLLMFRFRSLSSMFHSEGSSCQPRFAGFPPGRDLPASLAEDPAIMEALTLVREAHEMDLQASRALDPHAAIIAAVWAPSHEEKEMSTAEITKRVNALLGKRGETYRYNSKQIGWKLRNLGLLSQHNGKRKALRFTRDVRRQIHRLASQFGLQLPKIEDCDDCRGTQLIGEE